VILTSFQIKDKAAPISGIGELELSYRQNGFSIEFAVPNAASPWKLRYRFRLEGLENRWVEVDSAHRVARYTGVAPGGYVFRAEASTDGRSWNPGGVALKIRILPPWWGTWWARSLAMLVLVGLLLGAHRLRVDALHRRQRLLAGLVEEKTAELESARNQAEAANRAKSAFLATMSHELRTPLNAILGFSGLLRDSGVTGTQREQVNIISRSGEHLLTLIDDVLDLAKIEAGKHVVAIASCDLHLLLNDVIEMMRVRAQSKNLELVCDMNPDLPRFVMTDAPKLRQVLINLLGNAVKFTSEGTVTLRLRAPAADDGRVLLHFEVEDTGIGIPAEAQGRIFEPFVQEGETTVQKGTGLGLTITRRFVELMNGTIGLESAPGRGTRFTVELPAELAQGVETAAPQAGHEPRFVLEPGQPEWRVLVVEDNPGNAMVLEQLLHQAGFRVRVAGNGALGVEQFRKWRPHFIWMDLRMPEMGGIAATRIIRALDGGEDVKIAAMSASALKSERDELLASGMDDFVSKPYRPKEVFESLARHLGVRYSQQGPAVGGSPEGGWIVRPEALAALPRPLFNDLKDAVVSLDRERIRSVSERVKETDEALSSALDRLVERFAFTAILGAIESSERQADAQGPGKIKEPSR
jgi:signal transduction histidine kinase/CheY-like chemotaxis protein